MQNLSQQPQFSEQDQLKCPRCDSANTKFCYYNNYNLSQPRHFCKSCRRYWTKGGALRNIPVGGGSRKNAKHGAGAASKRPASASASSDEKDETLLPLKGDSFGQGQFGNFAEVSGRNETTLLLLKGDDFFGQGQNGNFEEISGKNETLLSLKEGDFGQGQFDNFSGSFSALLMGSSSGAQFSGLLDGLGTIGPSLQTSEHFGDPGQNVNPQDDGFLNIGGGGGGGGDCWDGSGDWPDLAI